MFSPFTLKYFHAMGWLWLRNVRVTSNASLLKPNSNVTENVRLAVT